MTGKAARRVVVPLEIADAPPAFGATLHALNGATMGTRWSVKLGAAPSFDSASMQLHLQRRLDAIVGQMSPWEAGSDISRFNRSEAGTWHELPADFATVVEAAFEVARDSHGAFDPSAGELVDLWGFGPPGPTAYAPDESTVEAVMTRVGHSRLHRQDHRLQQPGGIRLDLSAIAKGHAVDALSALLTAKGVPNHLVEIGGELRGEGLRPDGQPWWVDLAQPPGAEILGETRIALHGLSVATSGDYVRGFVDHAGVRRSHTLDPRTGHPIEHGLASVTVLHRDCLRADAWSTALTVLGLDDGMDCAQRFDLAALFVQRRGDGFEERATPAWSSLST